MTSEETINSCKSKMKKAFDIFNSDLASLTEKISTAENQSIELNNKCNFSKNDDRLLVQLTKNVKF